MAGLLLDFNCWTFFHAGHRRTLWIIWDYDDLTCFSLLVFPLHCRHRQGRACGTVGGTSGYSLDQTSDKRTNLALTPHTPATFADFNKLGGRTRFRRLWTAPHMRTKPWETGHCVWMGMDLSCTTDTGHWGFQFRWSPTPAPLWRTSCFRRHMVGCLDLVFTQGFGTFHTHHLPFGLFLGGWTIQTGFS